MVYTSTLLATKNIDAAVEFYKKVLGLKVIVDFGANKTLTGGLSLQTLDTWSQFIDKEKNEIVFGNNAAEVYFEEDDMDGFVKKLYSIEGIRYVHKMKEYPWGQRVIRIYDYDSHIIEVGENMKIVTKRFYDKGMTVEQIAERMSIPIKNVQYLLK